jgi:hypothetical protein
MSFPDDENQDIAILPGRNKSIARFGAIMREVDGGCRVGRQYPEDFPSLHGSQALSRPQNGKRAKHSANIDLGVVVYQFAGHFVLFQLIVMMPISS